MEDLAENRKIYQELDYLTVCKYSGITRVIVVTQKNEKEIFNLIYRFCKDHYWNKEILVPGYEFPIDPDIIFGRLYGRTITICAALFLRKLSGRLPSESAFDVDLEQNAIEVGRLALNKCVKSDVLLSLYQLVHSMVVYLKKTKLFWQNEFYMETVDAIVNLLKQSLNGINVLDKMPYSLVAMPGVSKKYEELNPHMYKVNKSRIEKVFPEVVCKEEFSSQILVQVCY